MKYQPLGNRILVKREPLENKVGSLFVPTQGKDRPRQGVVISVGPGKMLEDGKFSPMQVQVGDRVMFNFYCGTELKTGEISETDEFVIMSQDDIICRIEG